MKIELSNWDIHLGISLGILMRDLGEEQEEVETVEEEAEEEVTEEEKEEGEDEEEEETEMERRRRRPDPPLLSVVRMPTGLQAAAAKCGEGGISMDSI